MKRYALVFGGALAVSILASHPAHAGGDGPILMCDDVALEGWSSEEEVMQTVRDMGFTPTAIKVEKGCWEIKAYNAEKQVYEFYIHPTRGDLMMRRYKGGGDFSKKPD